MRRGLKLRNYEITKLPISQRGYMMITLMLALALMTIALLTVLPAIRQQILRDREEEMVHRGTAYMRAIQHFYKKFGRYPSRVEELENTNNLRFLRKRYTDPMNRDPVTGKERDFKFLHQQDISLNNGPVLGQTPGQSGSSGFGGAQGSGGVGGLGAQPQTGSSGAQTPASGDSGNSSSGGTSDSGGIRIRLDRRPPIPMPGMPAPVSTDRRLAEVQYLGSPARTRKTRPFACFTERAITTNGSSFTCRRQIGADC